MWAVFRYRLEALRGEVATRPLRRGLRRGCTDVAAKRGGSRSAAASHSQTRWLASPGVAAQWQQWGGAQFSLGWRPSESGPARCINHAFVRGVGQCGIGVRLGPEAGRCEIAFSKGGCLCSEVHASPKVFLSYLSVDQAPMHPPHVLCGGGKDVTWQTPALDEVAAAGGVGGGELLTSGAQVGSDEAEASPASEEARVRRTSTTRTMTGGRVRSSPLQRCGDRPRSGAKVGTCV